MSSPRSTGTAVTEPAIALEGLTRTYGDRLALDDVTLAVPAGATLVVFGPNGAGKSTLLRVLATLLRAQQGKAVVLGHELPREAWALRGKVGLLSHEPLMYRDLSVRDNLQFHARLHGVPFERVEELLAATGLERRGGDPVRDLSRGLTQRAAVCRAVLHDPALLLLDEPLANLDPRSIDRVEPLIGRASGRTRVVTSHDPRGGLAEADLALGLRGGRVALLRDAAQVTVDEIGELYA
jgi:heme exporter protein A